MKRLGMRSAVVAVLGAAMVAFSTTTVANNNADDPTVKQIMQRANGKEGLCKGIGAGLKLKEPKWDDLQAKAKELVPLAQAMTKNKPPKGDAASWKKLSEGYATAAVDLEKAAAAKDAKGADAAMKVLSDCKTCHTLHK